ncbi:hypothetical protein F5888DRAFT_1735144, partial [Russula emetica]
MRRYKLAVHILAILSVFNFVPVLAAPISVQEAREACADVADGGEDVIIVSGKRAEEGQGTWSGYHGLTQASPGSSMSVQLSTLSQDPPGSPSTSDHASGVHQETTSPIQLPSSSSGGTKLSWYSSDDTGRDGVQPVQPGTTSKIPSISSVRTKTGKSWVAGSSVRTKTAKSRWKAGSSVRTKPDYWVPTTETEPASSSSGQITPASSSKDLLSSEQIIPASSSKDLSPSEQVTPASSNKDLLLPEQEGYLAQTPTNQPKPQSKNFWGKLASKSKSFLSSLASTSKSFGSKLASISKSLVSELVDNPRLQLRSSATAGGGVVNAAQSELQGTVHTEA